MESNDTGDAYSRFEYTWQLVKNYGHFYFNFSQTICSSSKVIYCTSQNCLYQSQNI